jgi:hypothetical protein
VDNDGTAQPAAPEKQTVGILSLLNTSTCTDNDIPHNLQHQKSELLGYFTFNTNLRGIMMVQLKPTEPTKANFMDTFTFNNSFYLYG